MCHTCAISMDNILVESIRNSAEMSMTMGEGGIMPMDEVLGGAKGVLARSFEETVKDTFQMSTGMVDLSQTHMSMMATNHGGGKMNQSQGVIDLNFTESGAASSQP